MKTLWKIEIWYFNYSSALNVNFCKYLEFINLKSWCLLSLALVILDLFETFKNEGNFFKCNCNILIIIIIFQTDFDDGHCPTWKNQLLGLYNIYQFVHGNIAGNLE